MRGRGRGSDGSGGAERPGGPGSGPREDDRKDAPVSRGREAGSAGERLERARRLADEGRARDAEAAYRAILQDDPFDVRARNDLGVLYDRRGAHDLAVKELQAALDVEPENVEVLTNLGRPWGP